MQHLGDWQGMKIEGRGATPKNAEPVEDFTARATEWWSDTIIPYALTSLHGRGPGEGLGPTPILLVSHGGYIHKMVSRLIETGQVVDSEGVMTGKCWNASVSVIEVEADGKGVLVTYSDTLHLKGDLVDVNVDVVESSA